MVLHEFKPLLLCSSAVATEEISDAWWTPFRVSGKLCKFHVTTFPLRARAIGFSSLGTVIQSNGWIYRHLEFPLPQLVACLLVWNFKAYQQNSTLSLIIVVNPSPAGRHHSWSWKDLLVQNSLVLHSHGWGSAASTTVLVFHCAVLANSRISYQAEVPQKRRESYCTLPAARSYWFIYPAASSAPHPTQLQLAAESHLMVCQMVRASIKETVSKRVGRQQGWVLILGSEMPPLSIRYLRAMS